MSVRLFVTLCVLLYSGQCCKDCTNKWKQVDKEPQACSYKDGIAMFGHSQDIGAILNDGIASLGASRKHPGYLYAVNDNGNEATDENYVLVIDELTAEVVGTMLITGALNHDWEELAVGVCPDDHSIWCIYINDGGDHAGMKKDRVYIIEEPDNIFGEQNVALVDTIEYGPWTVGALLFTQTIFVDPQGEIYFFDRTYPVDGISLYQLMYDGTTWTAEKISPIFDLPSSVDGPDASDMSVDGTELLVAFGDMIYYFHVVDGDILEALKHPQLVMAYTGNQEATSVAWSVTSCGFYVGNQRDNSQLMYYDRFGAKSEPPPQGPLFSYGQVVGMFTSDETIVGMTHSLKHPDYIYLIEDGTSEIQVIQASNGLHISTLTITGGGSDWTGMTIARASSVPGDYSIYILREDDTIIRLPEPDDITMDDTINIPSSDVLAYDSTDLTDSQAIAATHNGDILLASFADAGTDLEVTIYQLVDANAAELVPIPLGSFIFMSGSDGPVSMEVSPCGRYMLIKNQESVWMFPIKNNDYVQAVTNANPTRLPYLPTFEEDAITISPDGKHYYTINKDSVHQLKKYDMLPPCHRESYW